MASEATLTDDARDALIPAGRLGVLERRATIVDSLLVLTTVAVAFVVLGFLASYFQAYLRIILIFFFAWLLAFLLSPIADFMQRRVRRLPRAMAVILVLVPIIGLGAFVLARVAVAVTESFSELVAALPGLATTRPEFLAEIQALLDARGVEIDAAGLFQSVAVGALDLAGTYGQGVFSGIAGSLGVFVDAIVVVSLAVFMAIDRDRLLRFGLDVTPPERRDEALLLRRSVGSSFAGFIRSQLALGGLYGLWAFATSLLFGLQFGLASAVISGLVMAIPIYGPYVSWLPPVVVALVVRPDVAVLVAGVMLVGWFIDENVLAPVVRAGALEVHPIVVTFAFLLGAELAGALGAVVAIPLAAVVQAFFQLYFERYRTSRGWPRAEVGSSTSDQ